MANKKKSNNFKNRELILDTQNLTAKNLATKKDVANIIYENWRKGNGRMAIRKAVKEQLGINGQKAGRLIDEVYKHIEADAEDRLLVVKLQMLEICHTQLSKLLEEEKRPNHNMILKYIDMIAKLHNIYTQPNVQQQNIITFKFGDDIDNNTTTEITETINKEEEMEVTDVEFNIEGDTEDGSERI